MKLAHFQHLTMAALLLMACRPGSPKPIDFPFHADYALTDIALDPTWNSPIASPADVVLPEISGAAQSQADDEFTWMLMDSGDSAHLYLMDHRRGTHLATLKVLGVHNEDWEDMASVTDSLGNHWLFVADIGDNAESRSSATIYAFHEPPLASIDTNDASVSQLWSPSALRTWEYVYEDGAQDAESFFVDPMTMKLLVWSKRSSRNAIYELPAWPSGSTDTAVLKGTFPMTHTTAADCARLSDGSMPVILRNYQGAWIWPREADEPLYRALVKQPYKLPYTYNELQGEAIWWQGESWSTISESPLGMPVKIWTYSR